MTFSIFSTVNLRPRSNSVLTRKERNIQARVLKYIKTTYPSATAVKIEKSNVDGIPDISVDMAYESYSRHFWIELKAFGKKPSKHQKRVHDQLRAAGSKVFVCNSYEAAVDVVDKEYKMLTQVDRISRRVLRKLGI